VENVNQALGEVRPPVTSQATDRRTPGGGAVTKPPELEATVRGALSIPRPSDLRRGAATHRA
jgi:hypothetical protein